MANAHRIHLVRSPQDHEPKPKRQNEPLDPVDIVAEVFSVVNECRVALAECQEYTDMIRGELASRLDHLEVSALRTTAAKGRRS